MSPAEAKKLIDELIDKLRDWAGAEYGRSAKLAKDLKVPRQLVTDWFKGRKTPTWISGLQIQDLLKKHRRTR